MSRFSALLDACVLVPIALADSLLRLADADLFRPLWSERILDEMVAIEEIHPGLAEGSARRRAVAMDRTFDDACVRGWESLVQGIRLPDVNDRHVVAAALRGQADLIVTANVRDFPAPMLEDLGVEAQNPEDLLLNQLDLDPDVVIHVLFAQAAATRRPAMTFDELLNRLARCGVPRFAQAAAQQKWRGT